MMMVHDENDIVHSRGKRLGAWLRRVENVIGACLGGPCRTVPRAHGARIPRQHASGMPKQKSVPGLVSFVLQKHKTCIEAFIGNLLHHILPNQREKAALKKNSALLHAFGCCLA